MRRSGVLHCSAVRVGIRKRSMRSSAQQGEGDDGFAGVVHLGEELFFELVRERHFAGGDLVIGGSDEAELAAGEAITFRDADGRAKDAAGHWAEGVDVAETGVGIEGGAGCVIGEVFEAGVVLFGCSEDSSVEVAGEIWGVLGDPCTRAVADCLG